LCGFAGNVSPTHHCSILAAFFWKNADTVHFARKFFENLGEMLVYRRLQELHYRPVITSFLPQDPGRMPTMDFAGNDPSMSHFGCSSPEECY